MALDLHCVGVSATTMLRAAAEVTTQRARAFYMAPVDTDLTQEDRTIDLSDRSIGVHVARLLYRVQLLILKLSDRKPSVPELGKSLAASFHLRCKSAASRTADSAGSIRASTHEIFCYCRIPEMEQLGAQDGYVVKLSSTCPAKLFRPR